MILQRYWRWIAVTAAGVLGLLTTSVPADLSDFAGLGDGLLGGGFGRVYEGAWNQAGPLQLVISRLLLVGGRDGMPSPMVMALVDAGLMLGALAVARRSRRTPGWCELATAVLTLLWLAGPVPWNGHPAEVAIPACWAFAVALQRRHRPLAAATVLAAAVAIAPWAVLGFPCLLAAASVRQSARTALLAAAFAVLAYAPFAATGTFGMFGQVWDIAPGSLLHAVAPDLQHVTWPARLVQGVVVAGGCALLAHRYRGQQLMIGAAPLAAALLRVATDPLAYTYYWTPVAVGTVLLLALMPDGERRHRQLLAVAAGYLALLAASAGSPAGALASLGLLAAVLLRSRPRRGKQPGSGSPRAGLEPGANRRPSAGGVPGTAGLIHLAARHQRNTNGLLCQYFPKGTSLAPHDRQTLRTVEDRLNQRPRKVVEAVGGDAGQAARTRSGD